MLRFKTRPVANPEGLRDVNMFHFFSFIFCSFFPPSPPLRHCQELLRVLIPYSLPPHVSRSQKLPIRFLATRLPTSTRALNGLTQRPLRHFFLPLTQRPVRLPCRVFRRFGSAPTTTCAKVVLGLEASSRAIKVPLGASKGYLGCLGRRRNCA